MNNYDEDSNLFNKNVNLTGRPLINNKNALE